MHWFRGWSWGNRSAKDIIEAAKNVDNPSNDIVKRLARLQHEKNGEQLLQKLVPMDRLPPLTSVADSMIDTVILPHDSWNWYQTLDMAKFKRHLGFREEGMAGWWRKLRETRDGQELWRRNKYLRGRTPDDLNRHVPLCLFDDAGPVAHAHSSFVRCFFSITGQDMEMETRILLGTGLKEIELPDLSWPCTTGLFLGPAVC